MTDATETSYSSRSARTSPDAVAERTFSQVKRGYAESEVRAYLRMVAEDLAGAAERERALEARLRELEDQARRPVLPPSEHDLIAALGEETARVLGHARDSAAELKAKAEEHARRVVREAQEAARELRTTTQQAVEAKTREAEDAARARAKEIVGEARVLRERVLQDLEERRQQLEQQVAQLRDARGKLVDAHELVERALAHATRVMQDEPSVAPPVPAPSADVPQPPATPADTATETQAPVSGEAHEHEVVQEAAPSETEPAAAEARDVRALFERLRTEQTEEAVADEAAPDAATTASEPASETDEREATAEPQPEAEPEAEPEAADEGEQEAEAAGGPPAAIAARDEVLDGIAADLVRSGKRALQDEQNDVLDGLRRQRGKIDVHKVLPTTDEQLSRWAHVLQPSVDKAYQSGAESVGGSVDAAPRAVLAQFASDAVTPLRERLSTSLNGIDARNPADAEIAIAQRLGARYREWRGQELETVLGDVLAASYARGAYDAAPEGARLRWVASQEGKCPDCDDNALEPTVKGGEFPTGQTFPPAHPGCRCTVVLDKD